MGVLEALVVATIVLAGAYVGYHAWQDSLDAPEGGSHSADLELGYHGSQIPPAESYSQVPARLS